jgi:hypothetical protein
MDLPPNGALTITWPALLTAGEHSEGHCLGRGEPDRARHVRKELARLYRNEGLPFAALWGRHISRTMAAHVHIFMCRPHAKLISVIARISGISTALGKAAQARARPMLAAREAPPCLDERRRPPPAPPAPPTGGGAARRTQGRRRGEAIALALDASRSARDVTDAKRSP